MTLVKRLKIISIAKATGLRDTLTEEAIELKIAWIAKATRSMTVSIKEPIGLVQMAKIDLRIGWIIRAT